MCWFEGGIYGGLVTTVCQTGWRSVENRALRAGAFSRRVAGCATHFVQEAPAASQGELLAGEEEGLTRSSQVDTSADRTNRVWTPDSAVAIRQRKSSYLSSPTKDASVEISDQTVSRETIQSLSEKIWAGDEYVQLELAIADSAKGSRIAVRGPTGSLPAFLIAGLSKHKPGCFLCLVPEHEDAAYLASDIAEIASEDNVLLLPPSGDDPYDPERLPDTDQAIARNDVLQAIISGTNSVIVASVEALIEKAPSQETIETSSLKLVLGAEVPPETIAERLIQLGFRRTDYVQDPGELAIRGGIVDVYPYAGAFPVRIEFFGNEIDSIREFDTASQRSVSRLDEKLILPNLQLTGPGDRESILALLPDDATLVLFGEATLAGYADKIIETATRHFDEQTGSDSDGDASANGPEDRGDSPLSELVEPSAYFLTADRLTEQMSSFRRLDFSRVSERNGEGSNTFSIKSNPQPAFNSHLALLRTHLEKSAASGIETIIFCDGKGQRDRLAELLDTEIRDLPVSLLDASVQEGFVLPSIGLAVYTDHQIFDRFHRPKARKTAKKAGISLRELKSLKPGDFVVHTDYGVGQFVGLQYITVREQRQEVVRLSYRDRDTLYVNISALHKLHRYTGKEGHHPQLTKLGSGQWEKVKTRTRKRVKDIARDLIKLYAKRMATPGFAFQPDTVWQREMEAAFKYEDTPDQAEAAEAVKDDMTKPVPMDRLVCGDVGFGKTEIAIRAAFKAVQDGKQVAILVPTTVLADQHGETFTQRLKDFPVNVDVISRFRTKDEVKTILKNVKRGDVDILIGTHRIVSKDVEFKNLGLMIIDEEQRFGVTVKEKLKQMRVNVDTLTLTATPIPRTLQFSLLGARDLSIIATAPPNRQPILTEIHSYSTDLIREAIQYEIDRDGQVFFIHNRVQSIEEMSGTLRNLIPSARIQVAHGQMPGPRLEKVMLGFKEHKFDILLSTNIIENGLDIANANTIIINNANRFGLAELHQIRGRVGRSDRKAYCYLLVPSVHTLTKEAKQRLNAIEEFSELGSGFNLAMRDLDIRGAGNMLGAEQSGFIADVGFETYHKILDEAVQELRADEFAELFRDAPPPPPVNETVIELDAEALLPADYVADTTERLNLYRQISGATDTLALAALREELKDRFGEPPAEVDELLFAARLKLIGQSMRLAKVSYKNERLFLSCPGADQDQVFFNAVFKRLLAALTDLKNRYVLKESKGGKLRMIVQDVPDPKAAEIVLSKLAAESVGATIA